jgi:WD40 repeat protein
LGAEAEALLSVPNLLDTELADIYHLPSMKRIHAGVNMVKEGKGKMRENAGKGEPTRSGLIMSLHLRWLTHSIPDGQMSGNLSGEQGKGHRPRLVLVLGYEDGRVDMWGLTDNEGREEKGREKWRMFTDGSGQVGKRGWEVMWSGKGHNEAGEIYIP